MRVKKKIAKKESDAKKAEKKPIDKKGKKKPNVKTGLPLLHEFKLFEDDNDLKATTIRANRLHELDEGLGEKFLSFEDKPIIDNTRRYMVVVENCMEYIAFF